MMNGAKNTAIQEALSKGVRNMVCRVCKSKTVRIIRKLPNGQTLYDKRCNPCFKKGYGTAE